MRRRRYLQMAALGLAGGLAGCNDAGSAGTPEPTDAPTDTPTDTPELTDTPEPTPRQEPRNLKEPPGYMTLLPERQVGGTNADAGEDRTENAVFYRMDWQWYLGMQGVSPQFGKAAQERWDFSTDDDNFRLAPRDDSLKTPVWGVLLCLDYIDVQLPLFPNLGPVLRDQLGLNAEEGEREAAREVDQVIFYRPGFMHFVGVDPGPIREALDGQQVTEQGDVYRGGEGNGGRRIVLLQPNGVPVLTVMVDNFPNSLTQPAVDILERNAEKANPVYVEESVQWCLDQLADASAPVVTGEVNGGRAELSRYPHDNRNFELLEPFDTVITTMDASRFGATVQTTVSSVDGNAPTGEELREAFDDAGSQDTQYHPNVSSLVTTWP